MNGAVMGGGGGGMSYWDAGLIILVRAGQTMPRRGQDVNHSAPPAPPVE